MCFMIIQTESGLKRAVFSLDTEGSPVHEGRMRGGGREGGPETSWLNSDLLFTEAEGE